MKIIIHIFVSYLLVSLLALANALAKDTSFPVLTGKSWPEIEIRGDYWKYTNDSNRIHNKALSGSLKKHLLSSKTKNPFKVVYSDIYSSYNSQKLEKCSFYALKLDLDNNPNTNEWIISAYLESCLYGYSYEADRQGSFKNYYYSDNPHNWILQKDTQGQYRVILESDDPIYMMNRHDPNYNTNALSTKMFLGKINRNNKTLCGAAEISWQYKDGQLYPFKAKASADGCYRLFVKIRYSVISPDTGRDLSSSISKDDWVFYQKLPRVQQQVDRLLAYLRKILSGDTPDTLAKDLLLDEFPPKTAFIANKKDSIKKQFDVQTEQAKQAQSSADKKTIRQTKPASNCTKNNALHKAAARGDYRFIAQCLRNL